MEDLSCCVVHLRQLKKCLPQAKHNMDATGIKVLYHILLCIVAVGERSKVK